MSSIKRLRESTTNIENNLAAVYKNGLRRVIIKSDESCRFIGVYYITQSGDFLKNINEVKSWLDNNSPDINLQISNFNFIAKKMSESCEDEIIIDQQNLPPELLDYVLEKKKSVAPDIKIENGSKIETLNITECFSEPNIDTLEKKSIIEDTCEKMEVDTVNDEDLQGELVFRPIKEYQQPPVNVGNQYVFEIGTSCHEDRLKMCVQDVGTDDIAEQFRPYCNNMCAYDSNGAARITFECDFCLILWHTDCSGYRWLMVDSLKLIICDNCYTLHKAINFDIANLFCDDEKLFQFKSLLNSQKNSIDAQNSVKYQSIMKLCKLQALLQKSPPSLGNLENIQNIKSMKKYKKGDVNISTSGRWKYNFQIILTPANIIRELKDEYISLKITMDNIDRLSKIFSDADCQLLIEDKYVQIFVSRITVKEKRLLIPIDARISKPCRAIFYTVDRNQEEDPRYITRCEELKTVMVNSLCMKRDYAPSGSLRENNNNRSSSFLENSNRMIKVTPISNFNGLKLLPPNYVIVSKGNSLGNTSLVKTKMAQMGGTPTLVKLRQRKQDFTGQKLDLRIKSHMRNQNLNLLNLPFLLLERILSHPCLSTQDKLNCRLSNRILKCIIDGGRVWRKLIINPGCITGLENMLTFFRTKLVKKITFRIDFQESFGIEFLLSFIHRLKMFPENMNLEKLSVKFTGYVTIQPISNLSVHDILSCCKSLKSLSISSEIPIFLSDAKKKLNSNSIEKLKLKNIKNISTVIQTDSDHTPNLKVLSSGDWSLITAVESFPLGHITVLKLFFGSSVQLEDVTAFSLLNNLEYLSIVRPIINDELIQLLLYILQSKRLEKLVLETVIPFKNASEFSQKLIFRFPKFISHITWKLDMENLKTLDPITLRNFKKQIQDLIPKNVQNLVFLRQ